MARPNLMGEPAASDAEVRLTPLQAFALGAIGGTLGGLTSAELGARVHARRLEERGTGHGPDDRCGFCVSEGRRLGEALRTRGLVARKRGGIWQLRTGAGRAPTADVCVAAAGWRSCPLPACANGRYCSRDPNAWPEGF